MFTLNILVLKPVNGVWKLFRLAEQTVEGLCSSWAYYVRGFILGTQWCCTAFLDGGWSLRMFNRPFSKCIHKNVHIHEP